MMGRAPRRQAPGVTRRPVVVALVVVAASIGPLSASRGDAAEPSLAESLEKSKTHTVLAAALKQTPYGALLAQPGPFTVFAPTDEAFKKLPDDAVADLLKPEARDQLTGLIGYHIVREALTIRDLYARLRGGNGRVTLTTMLGEALTLQRKGGRLELVDAKGNATPLGAAEAVRANGLVHSIDSVLLP